jgi:dephospho-CoA kinase
MSKLPHTLAVTGGIASGKSAASAAFERLAVPVIDADVIARELVQPGEPALAEIVSHFGEGVLDAEGGLDRRALRARIFADANARRELEAILHPRIRERMHARAAEHIDADYVVLAIPLLTPDSRYPWIERVLVIDVPESLQIERLTARDGVDEAAARAALAAQISRPARLSLADHVIENTGTLQDLEAAVRDLHQRLLGEWCKPS